MKDILESLPEIIGAGAQSFYGLIALAIVAVSILTIIVFRKDTGKIKIITFSLMIVSLITFLGIGFSYSSQAKGKEPSKSQEEGCLDDSLENDNPKIQISVVQHNDKNEQKLQNLFIQMIQDIKEETPAFGFNGVRLRQSDYYDEPSTYERSAISTITPGKFASLMDRLDVIPIFAIKKEGQIEPYYHASFISAKNSNIRDLTVDKDRIERIYVCAKTSLSGYIAPLNELHNLGIIDSVNENAIRRIGWEVINVQHHDLVYERVKADNNAIGATGLYVDTDPRKADVTLVHQYGRFPQDVLVISKDLENYRIDIQNWFEKIEREEECKMEVFIKSPTRISGFTRMNDALLRSYRDLSRLMQQSSEQLANE